MTTLFRLMARSVLGRGRVLALGALGAVAIGLAIVLRLVDTGQTADKTAVDLINALGLAIILPIGALVVASATLGQMRDDATLVYVWLRPVGRGRIVIAAWAAAFLVTLVFVALPLVIASVVAGGGGAVAAGVLAASILGLAAYCALFTFLGLRFRNALLWGLLYVLLWEGVLAALGSGVNRLALRNYTRSLLSNISDVPLRLSDASTGTAVVVLVMVTAVALVIGRSLLRKMDIE